MLHKAQCITDQMKTKKLPLLKALDMALFEFEDYVGIKPNFILANPEGMTLLAEALKKDCFDNVLEYNGMIVDVCFQETSPMFKVGYLLEWKKDGIT